LSQKGELRRQLMPGLKKFVNSCTSVKELSVVDTITSREDGSLDTINRRDAVADETIGLGMIGKDDETYFLEYREGGEPKQLSGTLEKLEEVVEGIPWITTTKASRFPASYKLKTNMKKWITAFKAGSIERDADNKNKTADTGWSRERLAIAGFMLDACLVLVTSSSFSASLSTTRAIRVTTRILSLLHSISTVCRIEQG
jgi:hypothetical protein